MTLLVIPIQTESEKALTFRTFEHIEEKIVPSSANIHQP